jgi:hypothetical protein
MNFKILVTSPNPHSDTSSLNLSSQCPTPVSMQVNSPIGFHQIVPIPTDRDDSRMLSPIHKDEVNVTQTQPSTYLVQSFKRTATDVKQISRNKNYLSVPRFEFID